MRSIAFLRRSGAPVNVPVVNHKLGTLGHVAWAFEESANNFVCGSLENIDGGPYIKGTNNAPAYWMKRVGGGIAGVFAEMKHVPYGNAVLRDQLIKKGEGPLTGYDEAIIFDVAQPDAQKAMRKANEWGNLYVVAFANCLDNTFEVLYGYGTFRNWKGFPPTPEDHRTPKGWFSTIRAEAISKGIGKAYTL